MVNICVLETGVKGGLMMFFVHENHERHEKKAVRTVRIL